MHAGKKNRFIILLISLMMLTLIAAACGNGNDNKSGSNNTGGSTSDNAGSTAGNTADANSSGTEPSTAERTMTDGLGHEVNIPANPERIIASYLEDYLVTLGVKPAAQWTVANGIQEYLQDTLKGIPTIPYDLPYEAVTSFNPDLIIIGGNGAVEGDKYTQYNKIAPTFVLGDEVNGDWRKALLKVGEVLGKSEEAQKALDEYNAKAADAKAKIQEATGGTKSAAAIWLVNKQFFVVSDKLSSGAVLYQDLGVAVPEAVKKLSESAAASWNPISLEALAQMDTDYIFLVNSDEETGSEALKDPLWKNIPAVASGNVFQFNRNSTWLYYGATANSKTIDHVLESIVK
ncbi:ABC transporter substrate-binding protein [Paenibacillus nasutitermitis]|uniref:Ferrichrome ABC transporter substrate-binding protein n=1 Tax=Paenibacillus nasutitermitis TaxID=1652958 RepID=A0A916ZE56_9BACL|nr:ABC transporter substrate-binding protein [Paenibacillus nasutitermitis]GGD89416.1 ferrichrome ABC transporter substrate-binding protein [Paenibacillus nasutitermitis]